MRILSLILFGILLCVSFCQAKDVSVKGYTRKDGTYVRPHHRSSPDNDVSNNYGSASYQQRQQYQGYQTLPSYNNDYDNDGVVNRYDKDDDNDGIADNQDSSQYGKSNSYQYKPERVQTINSNNQIYQTEPQSEDTNNITDDQSEED